MVAARRSPEVDRQVRRNGRAARRPGMGHAGFRHRRSDRRAMANRDKYLVVTWCSARCLGRNQAETRALHFRKLMLSRMIFFTLDQYAACTVLNGMRARSVFGSTGRTGETATLVSPDVHAASEATALLMLSTGILKAASVVFWTTIS